MAVNTKLCLYHNMSFIVSRFLARYGISLNIQFILQLISTEDSFYLNFGNIRSANDQAEQSSKYIMKTVV